ncbi:MAG: twin-arginine translocase TatA/TatE family subunit [Bacteroidota bacterium]
MSLGPWEIGLIFLVILLVFGAKRIPEIARGLGKGIREFKDATNDIKQELNVADSSRPSPPRQVPQQTQYQQQPYTPPQQQQASAPPQQAPPQPTAAPPSEGQAPSA